MSTVKTKPIWKDGRRFLNRVQVWGSPDGIARYLFRAHAEEAALLCRTGNAEPEEGRGDIKRIRVLHATGRPKPGRELSIYSYMGQHYCYNKKVSAGEKWNGAKAFEFVKLEKEDRPIFLLSVTDCLTEFVEPVLTRV